MAHQEYDKAVGAVIKDLMKNIDVETFARSLSIQCLRNLPCDDRGDFHFACEIGTPFQTEKSTLLSDETIKDYIKKTHNKANSVIIIKANNDFIEKSLTHSLTKHSITNYLIGRTTIPSLELMSVCQLLEISLDTFMSKVYDKLDLKWTPLSFDEPTIEDAYNAFSQIAFGDRQDNRYVYNTTTQKHLLTSLFLDGKEEHKLHFTYLPMNPGLKDIKGNAVFFQRGVLTFEMRNGMCHVTSNVKVGSQGIPSEYRGLAIIMNPKSNGTTCTCFLREIGNTYGVFVLFTFRISPLDRKTRQTRISECMAVRRSDGTPFVYRLLLSENYINDDEMKYFMGHLKLCTSENTSDGNELNILIKEKYISIAKNFFSGGTPRNTNGEVAVFLDLEKQFGTSNHQTFLNIINKLEQSPRKQVEKIITINPSLFSKMNMDQLLFIGWLGKWGLSARHDKVENLMDDEIENIHKLLYPDLHPDTGEWF